MCLFFFNDTATTEIYTLSLHDALPISRLAAEQLGQLRCDDAQQGARLRVVQLDQQIAGGDSIAVSHEKRQSSLRRRSARSEEHTSELQSHLNLVCRLLLEKKKKQNKSPRHAGRRHCFPCRIRSHPPLMTTTRPSL